MTSITATMLKKALSGSQRSRGASPAVGTSLLPLPTSTAWVSTDTEGGIEGGRGGGDEKKGVGGGTETEVVDRTETVCPYESASASSTPASSHDRNAVRSPASIDASSSVNNRGVAGSSSTFVFEDCAARSSSSSPPPPPSPPPRVNAVLAAVATSLMITEESTHESIEPTRTLGDAPSRSPVTTSVAASKSQSRRREDSSRRSSSACKQNTPSSVLLIHSNCPYEY